jgi:trigger factor
VPPLYEDKVIDFILTKASVTDKQVSIDELTAEDDEAGDTKPKKKGS